MRSPKPLPPQSLLKELFDYDPDTGLLTNRVTRSSCAIEGERAGTPEKRGYWQVSVQGTTYQLHRLIWMLMKGEDPGFLTIDHRNRNPSDNSWENLRLANQDIQEGNKDLGPTRGVCFIKSRGRTPWRAAIYKNRRMEKVAYFPTQLEAITQYGLWAQERWG